MFVCRRAKVNLSPDLWSVSARKHTELSPVTFFFHCNTNFFLHSVSQTLCMHTAGSHSRKGSTKWWLQGRKPGGLPSLALATHGARSAN